MGFSGYLLIVADFIGYARGRGIPVGPGRGSVVGSLVSYALGITEVDPVEHRLLFERWLNPGRKSMPDIDVDFCFERRDEVLEYVRKKYGDDRVAQIITFGTIKGKQAIRDVGRVLGLSFAETDKIVKLYPAPKQGRDFPLADALDMEPRLKAERKLHPDLFNYAFKLEGLLRHASRHAAGVVISDQPLTDLVPLYVDKERDEAALSITQYSMKGVDEIGLIKFDFLALKNLTLIADTLTLIKAGGKEAPDLNRLRLDDADTYKMLSRGDTVGVFQLESSGMRRFISELKPTCFDDVIAAGSLFRPGPLDSIQDGKTMVQHYVDRKHGKEPVEYDHPLLEPVLRETYGVIVYQEQVMRAAQALAGYSLEQADVLRYAMGKKNKAVMEKERASFIDGAKKNGVNAALAEHDFRKDRNLRVVRIQSLARRRIRADYLHDRLPESALSARVHGGADVARHGRRRQDLQKYRGAARYEDCDPTAGRESEPGEIRSYRWRDSLRAGCDSRRRQQAGRSNRRGARSQRARSRAWRIFVCASARN